MLVGNMEPRQVSNNKSVPLAKAKWFLGKLKKKASKLFAAIFYYSTSVNRIVTFSCVPP